MATERVRADPRLKAQGAVLKRWREEIADSGGQNRRLTQQELGLRAGYGNRQDAPKTAAVAISRIEAGKTDPSPAKRARLLEELGRTEAELEEEIERILAAPRRGPLHRALAGGLSVENEARQKQIVSASQYLNEQLAREMEKTQQAVERADIEFVRPFLEVARTIEWPEGVGRPLPNPGRAEERETARAIRELRAQTVASVRSELAKSAAGGIAGAGVGAGTAAGVFAAVSATATASTGTAIASLSGAAASSATLAWLGGGSLAAGGAGVAGGTMVLAGIVALPALLAMGGVLVWKGRRLRRQAEDDSARLDAAEEALNAVRDALPDALDWSDRQREAIQRATLLGRTIHGALVADSVPAPAGDARPADWETVPAPTQHALQRELAVLSLILELRALPIWLGVTSTPEREGAVPDRRKTEQKSSEWIEESLTLAQYELDDVEKWIHDQVAGLV